MSSLCCGIFRFSYSFSTKYIFLRSTYFRLKDSLYTLCKQQKSFSFLVFSGRIKWKNWPEMGYQVNVPAQYPRNQELYRENKKGTSLHKKWSFPLRISSVNVAKSAGNCGFWSHLLKKSLMESFGFCTVSRSY